MTSPGINPPPPARSGRMGALRDTYRKVAKPSSPEKGERRPWYRLKRRTK